MTGDRDGGTGARGSGPSGRQGARGGPPPFVDADWLADRLGEPGLRVLDVREAWEYEGIGHLPGAVNVPFDRFRDAGDADAGMLPGADVLAEVLGAAGVGPDDTLLTYDDEHGVYAARVAVTARLYGHEDARVLDGDFSAWSRHHPTETGPVTPEPVEYPTPGDVDRPLVGADEVRAAATDPATVLVDTRTREEFDAGHVRGAVQLDWRDLVDPETRGLRPADDLLDDLAARGLEPDRPVVLYCNTARRLSHTYLALRHLGFEDVRFYEGSLTDWRERGLDLVAGDG